SAELAFTIPENSPHVSINDRAKLLLLHKSRSNGQHQFSCELSLNAEPWDVRSEDEDILEAIFAKKRPGDPSTGKVKFVFGKELDDKNWIEPGEHGKHRVYVGPIPVSPLKTEVNELK